MVDAEIVDSYTKEDVKIVQDALMKEYEVKESHSVEHQEEKQVILDKDLDNLYRSYRDKVKQFLSK